MQEQRHKNNLFLCSGNIPVPKFSTTATIWLLCSGNISVPKSSRTTTNSLKIEKFLQPFTLKAVQELFARTGEVCSFWMDHIKTHC